MPDNRDDEYSSEEEIAANKKIIEESLRGSKVVFPFPDKKMDDNHVNALTFLNLLLSKLGQGSSDNEPRSTSILSKDDAKYQLQSDSVIHDLVHIKVILDKQHESNGEIKQKVDEVYSIAKSLFDDADIFKRWKTNINNRIKKLRDDTYNAGRAEINCFTCPFDQLEYDAKFNIKISIPNAIILLRAILASQNRTIRDDIFTERLDIIDLNTGKVVEDNAAFGDMCIEWINSIYKDKKVMFSEAMLSTAARMLARENKYHSFEDFITKCGEWKEPTGSAIDDQDAFMAHVLSSNSNDFSYHADYISLFITCVLGLGGEWNPETQQLECDDYTKAIFTIHLIAGLRRVRVPGCKYDTYPSLTSLQGINKTKLLIKLYGARHFLSEKGFNDLSAKEQSERTRHGKICVELPEVIAERSGPSSVKAGTSMTQFEGREAYGKDKENRPRKFTYVLWHTGNITKFLNDPTGNRRNWVFYLENEIDLHLLDQIIYGLWAQINFLETKGRLSYYRHNPDIMAGQEFFPDIELPRKFWEESKKRSDVAMEDNIYVGYVSELLVSEYVYWDPDETFVFAKVTDIRDKWLKGVESSFKITRGFAQAARSVVLINKYELDGLNKDVVWVNKVINNKIYVGSVYIISDKDYSLIKDVIQILKRRRKASAELKEKMKLF
jgi:hypothetical protein